MAVPFNLPSSEEHDSDILQKIKLYLPYLESIIAQHYQSSRVNGQTSNANSNSPTASTPSSTSRIRVEQNCFRELSSPSSSSTSSPSSNNLHSICDLALLINVNATTPDQLTVPPRSPTRRRRLNSECCCDELTLLDAITEDWIQFDNDDTSNSPLASLSTTANATSNQNNNSKNNNGSNSKSKSNNKTTISDDILSLMDLSLTESLWTATICCVGWHLIWPR